MVTSATQKPTLEKNIPYTTIRASNSYRTINPVSSEPYCNKGTLLGVGHFIREPITRKTRGKAYHLGYQRLVGLKYEALNKKTLNPKP